MKQTNQRILAMGGLAALMLGTAGCGSATTDPVPLDSFETMVVYNQIDDYLALAHEELAFHEPYVTVGDWNGTPVTTTHAINYPDPNDAIDALDSAATLYATTQEYQGGDKELEYLIIEVKATLSQEENLQTYQGEDVGDATFAPQREEITRLRDGVAESKDLYQNLVDSEIEEAEKDSSLLFWLGCAIGALFGFLYPSDYNREW